MPILCLGSPHRQWHDRFGPEVGERLQDLGFRVRGTLSRPVTGFWKGRLVREIQRFERAQPPRSFVDTVEVRAPLVPRFLRRLHGSVNTATAAP